MFSFFSRKKPIVVDCFTTSREAYEYTPLVRAAKTIPEWWKKLEKLERLNFPTPAQMEDDGNLPSRPKNMKTCLGFTELYRRGYVMEYWADSLFHVTEEGYKYHVTSGSMPDSHERSQFKGGFEKFHHLKLCSPWHFREKSRLPFMFIGCEWSNELPIKVLPGVVQFKTVSTTNINMMLPIREKPWDFKLLMGTSLVHIIPLDDTIKVKFKNHLVSEDELKKIETLGEVTYGGHRQIDKLITRNEERT